MTIPSFLKASLDKAHSSWQGLLLSGLDAMTSADPAYLAQLENDNFLPTRDRLFTAFSLPMDAVRYVLLGEGPYPREESATGYCFMDGAVGAIWSDRGFSKAVNRATSLRNFMKMLLVSEGVISSRQTSGAALEEVAKKATSGELAYVQTLPELQDRMLNSGFLLLNATLVFRKHVSPLKEARAWQPFFETIFGGLAESATQHKRTLPTLILWGKVAEKQAESLVLQQYPQICSEHPYNLSFIQNEDMQKLFSPMCLLSSVM